MKVYVQDYVESSSSQMFVIDDALLAEAKTSIQKEILGAHHFRTSMVWRMPPPSSRSYLKTPKMPKLIENETRNCLSLAADNISLQREARL